MVCLDFVYRPKALCPSRYSTIVITIALSLHHFGLGVSTTFTYSSTDDPYDDLHLLIMHTFSLQWYGCGYHTFHVVLIALHFSFLTQHLSVGISRDGCDSTFIQFKPRLSSRTLWPLLTSRHSLLLQVSYSVSACWRDLPRYSHALSLHISATFTIVNPE